MRARVCMHARHTKNPSICNISKREKKTAFFLQYLSLRDPHHKYHYQLKNCYENSYHSNSILVIDGQDAQALMYKHTCDKTRAFITQVVTPVQVF